MEEIAKLLRGLLALELYRAQAAADKEGRAPKFELMLADAGFGAAEIALMLGKTQGSVAKAISRARAARRSATDLSESQVEHANETQR